MSQVMKIAIVDDEQDMRQSISQWLALSGFDTETFPSAEDALTKIGSDYPGIVISDIKMPGMGGMGLLKKLMGNDSSLPVVMITGHGDVPIAVEAMRLGAFDFLEKPFNPDKMTEIARKAVNQRPSGARQPRAAPRAVGRGGADEQDHRIWSRHDPFERRHSGSGAGGRPCHDRRRNWHRQNPDRARSARGGQSGRA